MNCDTCTGPTIVQKCAAARASAFAASVCATHPASGSCMENTASATTSPASDSEGSCVEVSNRSNEKKKRRFNRKHKIPQCVGRSLCDLSLDRTLMKQKHPGNYMQS